ncbi:MAG: U32 family peptidase [Dehalococcoidales bacterium]
MPGLEFSVPYNNDPKTLDKLFELKNLNGNSISEVYLSGPQSKSAAGRIVEEIDEARFVEITGLIHKNGIRVNLIMNATCEGTGWYASDAVKEMVSFINQMHENGSIDAVTMANPIFIKTLRKTNPDIEICASVLGDIDCMQRALIFAASGASTITPDTTINRNLELLKEIKQKTGVKIKLMVNEGCLYKCPYRKFHFNYISHKSKELGAVEGDAFFAGCSDITREDHSQILKSGWVRPEDLGKYSDVTSFFKIVGRERPLAHVVRSVKAYMKERWNGDLLDIMCSNLSKYALDYGAGLDNKALGKAGFFEKTSTCNYECNNCDYCNKLAERLVRLECLTRGKLEDLGQAELADRLEASGVIPKIQP